MKCEDTLLAGTVFAMFGLLALVFPHAIQGIQLLVRELVPWGERMAGGSWLRSSAYVRFTRAAGLVILTFGLFCFYSHVGHCSR
jgi:hypothetical protein